jgi:hypothetical protein
MAVHVLTNRYNSARTGANMAETLLDTKSVAVTTFGKLFTRTVDGDLYAQPLIVSNVIVSDATRNVVFLATARNWVYAYDADVPDSCLPLWARNLGQPVPRDDIFENYLNFASYIGVTSTPVIEIDGRGGGTMYVVYKVRTITQGVKSFTYYLRALDITTGEDRTGANNPSVIAATAPKSDGTTIIFDPKWHLNRPGLLLSNGIIYMAFGSHGDVGNFYGWIMAYDSQTLKQVASYNTAPDWGQGGVWQSGTGLAADEDGYIYAVVGNGERPSTNAKKNPPILPPRNILKPVYGNSILKMELNQSGGKASLDVVDWFTASDTMNLNELDNDFIGGPVLFDVPPVDGSSGHLIIGGGKDGKIYLGDRNFLGSWMADINKRILQAEKLCRFHIHGAPVIWENSKGETVAFVWSEKDFLRALRFNGKTFDAKPITTSVYGFPEDELRMPGGILTVSANGVQQGTAIVWASHPTDDDGMNQTVLGTLRAFDASNLNNELWNSDMDAEGADRVGSFAKFCPPVVANGKVYLATFSRELVVYGLLSEIGKKPRDQDCGIFQLQGISFAGAPVQQSGSYACTRYDLRITGQGLGDGKDSFQFAFVSRDSDNEPEISITARVDGINASNYPNPYAGVMIRKFGDTTPNFQTNATRYAAVIVTKDKKVLFLHRDVDGGTTTKDGPVLVTFPCFVRLTATKLEEEPGFIEFVGEYSDDGIDWKRVSAMTKIAIDGRLMVGLAVTAQIGSVADTTTDQAHASFSRVAVVPAISNVTSSPPMMFDITDN